MYGGFGDYARRTAGAFEIRNVVCKCVRGMRGRIGVMAFRGC